MGGRLARQNLISVSAVIGVIRGAGLTGRNNEPGRIAEATQEGNPILWALQQYQKVIRRWVGALSVIEFAVLMQILDRTVGWQNTRRTISMRDILEGGRLYCGIGHSVKRASVMKAVRRLEDLGIVTRQESSLHHRMREYVINLDWQEPVRETEGRLEIWEHEDRSDYVSSPDQQQD
jgi:hypothetical protein